MTATPSDFSTAFPEFDSYQFSDNAVQWWLTFAQTFVNQKVWGPSAPTGQPLSPFDYGVLLYAAHNVALAIMDGQGAGGGGAAPGTSGAPASSKQVDKVSISYDVNAIIEQGAGNWNATSYGRRFARLAKQFGNAPLFVSPGAVAPGTAWAGPGFPFPGWWAW